MLLITSYLLPQKPCILIPTWSLGITKLNSAIYWCHKTVRSTATHPTLVLRKSIKTWSRTVIMNRNLIFMWHKTWSVWCEPQQGILTCAEGVDVLVELEAHNWAIVVNDVGLTIPGTRNHLLSAVSLQANTIKCEKKEFCSSYTTFRVEFH